MYQKDRLPMEGFQHIRLCTLLGRKKETSTMNQWQIIADSLLHMLQIPSIIVLICVVMTFDVSKIWKR